MKALLIFILTIAASPLRADPVVRKISEANLRAVAGFNSEYSDFAYMIEFLDYLQSCGLKGDIVQLVERPRLDIPDIRGLHLVVRQVDLNLLCFSSHWESMNSLVMRDHIRRVVRSGGLVLIGLQTFGNFHSVVANPKDDTYARDVIHALSQDRDRNLMIVLGRQATFSEHGPRSLSADILELATFPFPSKAVLGLLELMSRARGGEIKRYDLDSNIFSGQGLLEVKYAGRGPRRNRAPTEQIQQIQNTFRDISLTPDLTAELSEVIRHYLNPADFQQLTAFFETHCEELLKTPRRH